MNALEKRMVDALKDLKENHDVLGVKAEFEAEGTRMEEALRLKEVVTKAGLDLTIKIGGCEAIRDMYDARSIGVTRIVAPMIETPYALYKFIGATHIVYPDDEWETVDFLVNIETETGYRNFEDMLKLKESSQLAGVVLGRTDMSRSLGLTPDDINCDKVFDIAFHLLPMAKRAGKECVIGGGVSADSVPFFGRLPQGCLDKFETRKVLFRYPGKDAATMCKGILKAVGFELMWLKNKREFYGSIYQEDLQRIKTLQSRYDKSIAAAGGKYE